MRNSSLACRMDLLLKNETNESCVVFVFCSCRYCQTCDWHILTSRSRVVVSALEYGSQGHGFEVHQGLVRFFDVDRLLLRARRALGHGEVGITQPELQPVHGCVQGR